ncbi:MAG TPA: SpoIIE family protein phosphatase [Solirubrobacteraceae bacterium]|nr:SpoIIE family protein phosphatase [Solirubrobacteraceae bacterium]
MALSEHSLRVGPLTVQTAALALGDAEVSGDRYCAIPASTGVLLAVMDGLGHGAEAADAAMRACEALHDSAPGSLAGAVERCHAALRGTRGVVIALAWFPRARPQMEWLAVGNVEALLLHGAARSPGRETIVQRPGIVGYGLPALIPATVPVAAGDTLVLATDGVERTFGQALSNGGAAPADGAAALLRRFASRNDDALLVLARYVGEDA